MTRPTTFPSHIAFLHLLGHSGSCRPPQSWRKGRCALPQFPKSLSPQPHCTVCPCSFLERSRARCCAPGVGASGGWREEGEGVLPLMCSAVIRLTQLKVFFMHDRWGIICYSFSNCLTTVLFKVQCRLVRKSCLFT